MKNDVAQLLCVNRKAPLGMRIFVFVVGIYALSAATRIQASSAVAVAINSKRGLGYGYYHDAKITEQEASNRAIKECLTWNGRNPRIIASTSKLGFGAVLLFLRTDNKLDYAAALAAPTREIALSEAKKKAKSLNGRAFRVVREWNDRVPDKSKPIIMQKL